MIPDGVIFNAYPDSCGGSLLVAARILKRKEFKDSFRYFYVLPSLFRSDLDRGFSVISYELDNERVTSGDLEELKNAGYELKLDFVLNHLSAQSPQFRDVLVKGDDSPFVDTFIDWNKFWDGFGEVCPDGYIIPAEQYSKKLFMRKPELPILKVPFPDGKYRFYWNTFYQEKVISPPDLKTLLKIDGINNLIGLSIAEIVRKAVDSGTPVDQADFGKYKKYQKAVSALVEQRCTHYLGQMDLNAQSDTTWDFYEETFGKLASYGARIVRLDAFAYLHKKVGESNFFNEPGTWDYLVRIRKIADKYEIVLLPEIHSRFADGTHRKLAENGYTFYDFFFPGLVIDAIETGSGTHLVEWIDEIIANKYTPVNMLGCHDGIPVLDVQGILPDSNIQKVINLITHRGGRVKNLFGPDGKQISYYQVNSTFYSALGEDDRKMCMARAIQIFMPGIPEVWYLDLFAGTNDYEAADSGGHKEINRTNLTEGAIEECLEKAIVQDQLLLLKFRNQFPAFGSDSSLSVKSVNPEHLVLKWRNGKYWTTLYADLQIMEFTIYYCDGTEQYKLQIGNGSES